MQQKNLKKGKENRSPVFLGKQERETVIPGKKHSNGKQNFYALKVQFMGVRRSQEKGQEEG